MIARINSISMDCWDGGSPTWFHIWDNNDTKQVAFTLEEARFIRDNLNNMIKAVEAAKKGLEG